MASFWLEYVAHQTVSSSFVFVVTEMESPKDGDLPGICGHGLKEGPNQHYKNHMVINQQP